MRPGSPLRRARKRCASTALSAFDQSWRTKFEKVNHFEVKNSQVIGEAPEKTTDGVADPEDGVDQHGLVVLLANPVVLERKGGILKKFFLSSCFYLAGDRVEDVAIVKVPALVANLVRTSLHQAYHVVPEKNFVSCKIRDDHHLIAVNWSGSVSCSLREEKYLEERFLNFALMALGSIMWQELG